MHIAVSAVGVDRPGIVGAVARVLYEQGGNIEDSRMALLGGHFAINLIVKVGDDTDVDLLGKALEGATTEMDLIITARRVPETAPGHLEGTPYGLTVYGTDRPGIVAEVSGVLASKSVNITDLATRVVDGPVYVIVMEVSVPPGVDAGEVEQALREKAAGVDLSFHPIEAETL